VTLISIPAVVSVNRLELMAGLIRCEMRRLNEATKVSIDRNARSLVISSRRACATSLREDPSFRRWAGAALGAPGLHRQPDAEQYEHSTGEAITRLND
jgi:hypothetical protein